MFYDIITFSGFYFGLACEINKRYTLPAEYQVVHSLQPGSVFTDFFNPDPAMLSASSLGKGRWDAYH